MGLKFSQMGRYLIAAGSECLKGETSFSPLLYISVAGGKGWATRYRLDGKHKKDQDAAAAALHYGAQVINLEVKDVFPPSDPVQLIVVAEGAARAPRLLHF
jgi:hypothetical protein